MSHPLRLAQHPDRALLHNEVHARPPEALTAPLAIAHVVMLSGEGGSAASRAHLATLLRDHHLAPPDEQTTHVRIDVAGFRLRWEMHTEFVSWTFTVPLPSGNEGDAGAQNPPASAIDAVPQQWLAGLPGQCLCSMNVWVLETPPGSSAAVRQLLREDTLVGSRVTDGRAEVYTDFGIHADGFSRFVLLPGALPRRRLGRLVQRVLEIETYRLAAMLGLPAARRASSVLASAESELAALAEAIRSADREAEPALLDRLTRLAGQVESQHAATHSRLSASAAYFELMDRRIQEIGEVKIEALQSIGEFMERRLTPARKTCEWATRRQDALSQRVSRVSNLLRTRVEIEQQQSAQALLATMNSRQDLQLKLQSTVEGLSVAAITYYIVGLVSYLAKGAQQIGWPLAAETTAALAIPVVAFSVWWSLRRLHQRVFKH